MCTGVQTGKPEDVAHQLGSERKQRADRRKELHVQRS